MNPQALAAFAALTTAVQEQQAATAARDEVARQLATVQTRLNAANATVITIQTEKATGQDRLVAAGDAVSAAIAKTYNMSQAWLRAFTTQTDPSI